MEKRFYLGVVILLLLLGLGIAATVGMKAVHSPVEEALKDSAELAVAGDLPAALRQAREAYDLWQRSHRFTASLADHSPMDDTDTLFQEMLVYGQMGEVPHFAACCRQLAVLVQAIYDAHSFTWWNIL